VPVENVLGVIGEGHKVAFNILNLGRVKLGARNISGARQALNQSIKYAKERRQFGRPICEFGLVKQKLAEMSVRCFVGEAMVYRALGDVDRALEGIDGTDGARQLKTIETFAVECSINKVATSEALAYVVDEAVQVFGGNGYSREFPVERAYRDARITRIYEGTNEINRLIIPTRLLKNAAALSDGDVESGASGSPLAAERDLVAAAKRLAISTLRTASDAYGDTVRDEQEILAHAANIVIEVYAIESAIGRAEKMSKAGSERGSLAQDVVRVYASDAADRIAHDGKQIVNALGANSARVESLTGTLASISSYQGIDTVAARRRVGNAAIEAGRYPF
jgi:alkylation response protein AidB-like acyl-CoA dehydrogenase